MINKKAIWVAVSNSSECKFFTLHKGKQELKLIDQLSSPNSHLHNRDLVTDKPGRTFDSFGPGRHSVEPKTDPHRREQEDFSKKVGEALNKAFLDHKINELILVAGPKFLGDLRKFLHKDLLSIITLEVNKELTNSSEQDIIGYIFE